MLDEKAKIIAVANQKGGVGKTTTAVNLSASLVSKGKKVLLIDCDSQGNATMALGFTNPDELQFTLASLMELIVGNANITNASEYILHSQGIDLIASNTDLALMEISIVNLMCRETVLKRIIDMYLSDYDYVIIDTLPSLGILTINVFAAADSIIIPIEADDYYSARAMEALLSTISKVRKQINPKLQIEGVLMTKMDKRKSYKDVIYSSIKDSYGDFVRIFETQIPTYAPTSKMAQYGKTAISFEAKSKLATGYIMLADELIGGADNG